jgi:hypothetical protein
VECQWDPEQEIAERRDPGSADEQAHVMLAKRAPVHADAILTQTRSPNQRIVLAAFED